MFFQYGEKEITYLKQKDKRLAEMIDKIGKIEREVDSDLFSSVVHHIIGQQISTKAQATIWQRMQDNLGAVNADTVLAARWENEECVSKWRNFAAHRMAQKHGRMNDFADYKITVVTPIRSYTMIDRAAAPVDSNAYLEV